LQISNFKNKDEIIDYLIQKLYDRDELLADFRNYVAKCNPSKRYDWGEYEFKPLCE